MSKNQLKNILSSLMIDPISTKSPIPIYSQEPVSHSPLSNTTSTLCSMARPSLITRFFTVILEWIKWIFCCKSPPFINKIEKFQLACNIFKTLGAGGPWHWYWNRSQLIQWQTELEKFPPNPFEFLYFLFHDQEMTASMVSFKEQATTSTATMVCALIGRKNPWDEFIDHESRSFAEHGSPEMIPGFCTLLKLDQSIVSTFFNNKKWSELILYLLEERKKYFN